MSSHDYGRRSGNDLLHSSMCCKFTEYIAAAHLSYPPELPQNHQHAWLQCLLTLLSYLSRGVQYPKLYAEGTNAVSVKFNCTQRVHQNTMENLPSFLITQVLLAQAYPLLASTLGVAWAVGDSCAVHKCHKQFANGVNDSWIAQRLPGYAVLSCDC